MNLKYISAFGISLIAAYALSLIVLGYYTPYKSVFSDLVSSIINLGVAILLFYAANSTWKRGQRIYIAWILMGIAQLAFFTGDVLWGTLGLLNQVQSPSIADAFYLLYYPLFAIGILYLAHNSLKKDKQFSIYLDMGIVITSVTLIFLTLIIIPLMNTTDLFSLEFAVSYAYVILDFFLLVVLISLIFRIYTKSRQTTLFLLIIGVSFQVVTDAIYMNLTLYGNYFSGNLLDVGWIIGYVFTGIAAMSQIREQKIDFNKYFPNLPNYTKFKYRFYIPSIFAVISYITLIWSLSNLEQEYIYLLESGVGIIIFLVIIRQLVALNENKRLFLASQDEIYKRKTIERALRESEKEYREIVENVDEGILSTDSEGKITFINPKIVEMLGYDENKLIGNHVFSLMSKDSVYMAEKCLINVKKGNKGHNELQLIKKNGKSIDAYFRVSPVINKGNYEGCMGIILDITERKKANEALRESEEFNRSIIASSPDCINVLDLEGNLLSMSEGGQKLMEIDDINSILNQNFINLFKDEDKPDIRAAISNASAGGAGRFRAYCPTAKGTPKWWDVIITPILDADGNPDKLSAVSRDITERKTAEKEIEKSLKEKETLLREIHHRVKNNIQVISSLLSIQSRYIDDEKALEVFHEGQNRVRSMALVHEKLYKSDDLSNINIQDYIKDIIQYLTNTYDANSIKFNTNIEDITFNIDTAIPLGLIINEIITNSVKYAFPIVNGHGPLNSHNEEIETELVKEDGKYIMTISDNGIGLPNDFDIKNGDTLGLKLVNVLVKQLDGSIEVKNNNGTIFKINFREIHN